MKPCDMTTCNFYDENWRLNCKDTALAGELEKCPGYHPDKCFNRVCNFYDESGAVNCGNDLVMRWVKGCPGFKAEEDEVKSEPELVGECINTECNCYNVKYFKNCSALNLAGRLNKCADFIAKKTNPEIQEGKVEHKSNVTLEPAPEGNGEIVFFELMRDLIKKTQMGKEKYGTYLKTNNGRNALVDAYQEAIDLCFYLKQRLMEEE